MKQITGKDIEYIELSEVELRERNEEAMKVIMRFAADCTISLYNARMNELAETQEKTDELWFNMTIPAMMPMLSKFKFSPIEMKNFLHCVKTSKVHLAHVMKCCLCGEQVEEQIAHRLTDEIGSDGIGFNDIAIVLCDDCDMATCKMTTTKEIKEYAKKNFSKIIKGYDK